MLIAPKPCGSGDRKSAGMSIVMDTDLRRFLEDYRRTQGLRSIADAARELIYLGSLAVADA